MPRQQLRATGIVFLVRLGQSAYLNAVLVLAGGTAFAQALPIIVSPLLTRLYTPADFGNLSLFTALVASVGMAVGGRYDMAMLTPRRSAAARHLFALAIWVSVFFSATSLIVVWVAPDSVRRALAAESLGGWLYLVPLGLLLTGVRTTLSYWANRSGDFRALVGAQWSQALFVAFIALGLGALGAGFPGLLTGNLLGLLAAGALLGYRFRRDFSVTSLAWTRAKTALARRYRSYPLYSASSAVVDGVTMSLPVFFIAHHFPDSTLGHYSLVLRVASAPLSFISSAVGQVHLKRIVQMLHDGQEAGAYLKRLVITLAAIAAAPTLLLMPIAPWLFAHVFGPPWQEAGFYFQILMPSLAVRFVATTISGTMEATNNSHLGAAWKVTALLVTATVLSLVAPAGDIRALLIAMALCDITLYLLYGLLCFRASRRPRLGKI
ncbi:MAG: oligosaccharide flippase family protein [Piscinibacter sp.]|nr:oligosaccharide flippase family protein [Piscinibacter sp.]